MKTTIAAMILVWICTACNNSGPSSSGENEDAGTATGTESKEKKVAGGPAGCSRLVFFQSGAEVEATTYDGNGKAQSKQYTRIVTVNNEGGLTVAQVEGRNVQAGNDSGDRKVSYNLKCDGSRIFFDIASLFRTDEKNADNSFESSYIEYPINMTAGETLPDARGTMSSSKGGRKMTISYVYKDRKVEGTEKVTTAAGSWNCYKISNTVEAAVEYPGMDEKMKEMMKSAGAGNKTSTTTWFAPDFGIVKMEMYMNGKLVSKNEVTSVKM